MHVRKDLVESCCKKGRWFSVNQGRWISMSRTMWLMILRWKLSFMPWRCGEIIFLAGGLSWWVTTVDWGICLTSPIWMQGKLDGWILSMSLVFRSSTSREGRTGLFMLSIGEWRWIIFQLWALVGYIYRSVSYMHGSMMKSTRSWSWDCNSSVRVIRIRIITSQQMAWLDLGSGFMCLIVVNWRSLFWESFM